MVDERELKAFKDGCAAAIGDMFLGTVEAPEGHPGAMTVGFVTTEPDCGEENRGRFVDVILEQARRNGLHASVMPFPAKRGLIYEAVIRKERR